jgi:chorismate mutase
MNEQNKILEKLRTEIDSIDKNLLQLIEKRSNLASKIIKAKKVEIFLSLKGKRL